MTNQEAIKILESMQKRYTWNSAGDDALHMAIKALRITTTEEVENGSREIHNDN